MQSYPIDSPEAAARIVALTLIADGDLSKQELDVLDQIGAYDALGIEKPALRQVLQDFCEDLLETPHAEWSDARQIDPRTLQVLMAEVNDPLLRMTVLRLCAAIAEADGHIADGESLVLGQAVEQWSMHYQMVKPTSPDTLD